MTRLIHHLLATLLFAGLAFAQPLGSLAPAETAIALEWSWSGARLDTLPRDLAALPWEKGATAIAKLASTFADGDTDMADLTQRWRDWAEDGWGPVGMALPELAADCPAAAEALGALRETPGTTGFVGAGLLSVSLSPFNPLPAVTLLQRSADERLAAAFDAGIACAEEAGDVTRLEQDGTALFVLGDGGDLPLILARHEDLFLLSTNPEVLRGALRRAQGARETSLADGALYQAAQARFAASDDRLRLTLDFAALARAAEGVGGMMGGEAQRYLYTRGLAALRTLGGFAAQLSATDEGLMSETLLAPNPEGGDAALLDLLRCSSCAVSSPRLAPAETTSLWVGHLPYRELWAYLQDWQRGYAASGGEAIDLAAMLEAELGFDLDVALFDWLGNELHAYTLEPLGPDLRTLLYQPAQVVVVPVSEVEAARAGLAEWGEVLAPLWREMLGGAPGTVFGGDAYGNDGDTGGEDARDDVDIRETSYKGVSLTRVRFGPTTDFAYGFLGNYLVMGSPAAALEPVIDTYQGARGFTDTAAYRALRDEVPTGATSFSYVDTAQQLTGVAELMGVFVQPLAFLVRLGLSEARRFPEGSSTEGLATPTDLTGAVALPLYPGTVEGRLEPSTNLDATKSYELVGLEPGQRLTASVTSDDFDTYLALVDADTGDYLLINDDAGAATDSSFTFTVGEGTRYLLEVSSYSGQESGSFTLSVEPAAPDAEAEPLFEPGSYGRASDLTTSESLAVPGSATGELVSAAPSAANRRFYEISGVEPGDEVSVTLRSDDFDTYLYLIDADRGLYLDENDDAGGASDSALTFTVQPGVRYWVEVASYAGSGEGAYTLTLDVRTPAPSRAQSAEGPEASEERAEVGAPSYGELLDLFELLPQTLAVLADHLSITTGYTLQDETGIYSRRLTRITW